MTTYKYFIILFCNKKKYKLIAQSVRQSTIMEAWREAKNQKRPAFVRTNAGKKRVAQNFELGLIFTNNRWAKKTYTKDELGRNLEVKLTDEKLRIKDIIPYWKEDTIFDFETKKRIRYHQLMEYILPITEIAQIFSLNNKICVQVEDNVRMFGLKNIDDAMRLFDIIKDDVSHRKMGNFIFVKDISTHQRILLYNMLESKGFKRTELFRHYSY